MSEVEALRTALAAAERKLASAVEALRKADNIIDGVPGPEWGADEGLEKYRNWIGWCNDEMIKASELIQTALAAAGAASGEGET